MDFVNFLIQLLNSVQYGLLLFMLSSGLTLIYGVLHIINFAHGAALMMALYGVYFLRQILGIDPYLALPVMVGVMFVAGYLLQRGVIAELPEPGALTFCLGMAPPPGLLWRLPHQLLRLRRALGGPPLPPFSAPPLPLVGEPELPLAEAWRAPAEFVALAAAAACAGMAGAQFTGSIADETLENAVLNEHSPLGFHALVIHRE